MTVRYLVRVIPIMRTKSYTELCNSAKKTVRFLCTMYIFWPVRQGKTPKRTNFTTHPRVRKMPPFFADCVRSGHTKPDPQQLPSWAPPWPAGRADPQLQILTLARIQIRSSCLPGRCSRPPGRHRGSHGSEDPAADPRPGPDLDPRQLPSWAPQPATRTPPWPPWQRGSPAADPRPGPDPDPRQLSSWPPQPAARTPPWPAAD